MTANQMKYQIDSFKKEKQAMAEQIKKYIGFVERMHKDTAKLKMRLTSETQQNILLKEQLAKLTAEYSKAQQMALALSIPKESISGSLIPLIQNNGK